MSLGPKHFFTLVIIFTEVRWGPYQYSMWALQWRFTGSPVVVPGSGVVFQGGVSVPPVPPLDPQMIMLSNYVLMLTVV